MKIKNLKVTKQCKKYLVLATLGLITLTGTGCGTKYKETKPVVEYTQDDVKTYQPGEHIIAVCIDENPEDKIIQYEQHDGYKIKSMGTTYFTKDIVDYKYSFIVYENEYPVVCAPSTIDEDTKEFIYDDFGTPIGYEPLEEIEDKKVFAPGEHAISIPFNLTDMDKNMQFEYHEGYELASIDLNRTTSLYHIDDGGYLLYVNTVPVEFEKNDENIYTTFGTPVEEEKILEK